MEKEEIDTTEVVVDNVDEEEIINLGKCIALMNKKGDMRLKCEQAVNDIEIDDQSLAMLKGISELAKESEKKEDG